MVGNAPIRELITMQYVLIILLSILACVTYGVLHDQVTARICVEYFTIGHPPLVDTNSPTLIGLAWGVIATWWVGVILGVPLSIASRVGSMPKRNAASLVKPIVVLMLFCAVCAVIAGTIGHALATAEKVWLLEPLASRVPQDRHVAFLTDLWAHNASYISGFLGGIILIVVVLAKRWGTACESYAHVVGGSPAPST